MKAGEKSCDQKAIKGAKRYYWLYLLDCLQLSSADEQRALHIM